MLPCLIVILYRSVCVCACVVLFSGRINVYWMWMNALSTFKYPLQLLILNEFQGTFDDCWAYTQNSTASTAAAPSPQAAQATHAQAPDGAQTQAPLCVLGTSQVLQDFGISSTSVLVPLLASLGFFLGYRLLYGVALKLKTFSRRC